MIFYFSGTGNSLYAAKAIAKHNDEKLISIAEAPLSKEENYEYILEENESVGFVFPVYAWGPPDIVINFINRLQLKNLKDNYIFAVACCGKNIGNTMKLLSSALNKKSLNLCSAFTLVMPNNYIVMGDVDSKEVENKKLNAADITLQEINKIVKDRGKGVFRLVKGPVPFLLTSVIHPLFIKGASHTESFYTDDKCNGCGICEKVCSLKNIKVTEKPQWGKNCTQCHGCISYCPTKAIQFGKTTVKKGRYNNPRIDLEEMIGVGTVNN